jgi:hypothetical protein
MNATIKNQPADKARDAANQAVDKAKDAASQAGEAVHQAAHVIGQKAEDATSVVAGGIHTLAEKVREQGPDHGMLGKATQTVAGGLDDASKYLDQKNLSGMVDDVSGLIKRNPIPALLIGIGVGFLLGRTLRS